MCNQLSELQRRNLLSYKNEGLEIPKWLQKLCYYRLYFKYYSNFNVRNKFLLNDGEIKKFFELSKDIFEQVEINLKYAGYIKRQLAQVEEQKRLEVKKIPEDIDYDDVQNLRLEAREKLKKIKPETIGQASRISGVSPADIAVLLIYLKE